MSSSEAPRWNRMAPDERREEILRVAAELFASEPYSSVSVTAVAERAGVSRALVSHYFGGKRELYLTVLKEATQLRDSGPRTDLDLPVEERVAYNVDAFLDAMEQHREMLFAFSHDSSLDRDPEVFAIVDQMRDEMVDRMVINQFGTTDVPPAIRTVLRSYTGLSQVAVVDWLVRRTATRKQVHALCSNAMLALLRDVLPKVLAADADGP